MDEHKGWYQYRKAPHFDAGGYTQFFTFRLADSLPREVLDRVEEELRHLKPEERSSHRIHLLEGWLDKGSGSCILREESCAQVVNEAIQFLDGKRYDLRAWVVMPNHVHFLAYFEPGRSMEKALHSLKSYTSNELKKIHPEMDVIWQGETFDRYIRTEDHYLGRINYIHQNPVEANLCDRAEDFPWSSAYRSE